MSEDAIIYRFRGRPFAAETTLELREHELLAVQGARDIRVPYRDIARINLAFAPRGVNMTGFRGKIFINGGKTIAFEDRHWKSMVETEYPRREYRAFALALCARAGAANPDVDLRAGRHPIMMVATRLLAAGTTVLLAYLGVRAVVNANLLMAAMLLSFAALFGYWSWQFVMRNAPLRFKPRAVPEAVLPPAA